MIIIESLEHNKLIIAYDIPAIKHNFPIKEVIKVRTGDYKEMAEKILTTLKNKKYMTKTPTEFLERFKN